MLFSAGVPNEYFRPNLAHIDAARYAMTLRFVEVTCPLCGMYPPDCSGATPGMSCSIHDNVEITRTMANASAVSAKRTRVVICHGYLKGTCGNANCPRSHITVAAIREAAAVIS